MPRPLKTFHPKSVIFVTCSVEEGLLFPCNPLMNQIIWSALARAQALYPVVIVGFLFEGTHFHMLLVVDNPSDVPAFIGRFKTETAHAVNHLLGRKKRTIWCEGFDGPNVLDLPRTMKALQYLYTNPVKDGLAPSIDSYPGVSSWKMLRSGTHSATHPWLRRPAIKALPSQNLSLAEFQQRADALVQGATQSHTFTLFPDAWMESFGITEEAEKEALRQSLFAYIAEEEARHLEAHIAAHGRAPNPERLRHQGIDLRYIPQRSGYRSWCLATTREDEKAWKRMVKEQISRGREVQQRWRLGDYSVPYPLGLFPPSMPKIAEPMPGYAFEHT